MSEDIVERLRLAGLDWIGDIRNEAADEIEQLRSDKKLLEAGVREMANMIDDLRARNAELVAVLRLVLTQDHLDRNIFDALNDALVKAVNAAIAAAAPPPAD